jgi:membrane protein
MAVVSFLGRLRRRLTGVGLGRTAASLAFTTLLGVVPLFTVAFAYVSRFPLFAHSQDAFEAFLLRFFLPSSGAVVRHYLTEFVAKSAELKGVSTLFVVDREINTIWGTREPRSLARRVFVYALALTAGPALIGAAVYFINWLIEQSIVATSIGAEALSLLVQPVALFVDTAVFTLIYAFVPARSVPFRWALAGGLVAAIAFEAAKHGFRFYITQVPTYQVIYGALATLPLFLIWIYVSWVIVLVGAAITATLTETSYGRGR